MQNINAISNNIKIDSIKTYKQKLTSKKLSNKKLQKVCNEFTAFFVKQMISAMQKTVPKNKLINGGQAEEFFKDMLNYEYAKTMTDSNQLQLAEQLYNTLSRKI